MRTNSEIDESELLNDLRAAGYQIDSVWDFVNNTPNKYLPKSFTGSYNNAYPILVEHLQKDHHPRVKEGIIRALTEKDAKDIAADTILRLFYLEKNDNLKWVMANALKTLMSWKQRQKHPDIQETLGF